MKRGAIYDSKLLFLQIFSPGFKNPPKHLHSLDCLTLKCCNTFARLEGGLEININYIKIRNKVMSIVREGQG